MKKIVVLISGNGSNLQAIIDHCQQRKISGKIVAVISNKSTAYGLERAKLAKIPTHVIEHEKFSSREEFDHQVQQIIDTYQPDLIVLAGYMRILTPDFVKHYLGRMINIHPSLLPKYPGLHTYQHALEAGDKQHGTTVHFVTEELDGGPIILQAKVPILANDTKQTLIDKVQVQEYRIYPLAIQYFCDNRLIMQNNKAYLDEQAIPSTGCSEMV